MSKKHLLLGLLSIFFLAAGARAVTYNVEFSVGGNSADFPVTSRGFLIVDTEGDGFDFVTSNSSLIGKSDSKANEKWGNDDIVVFAGLQTVDFPNQGRGFNIPPTEISTDKWKEGDKLALVWFPAGASTPGSKFSYYTSEQVDHENGTIPFQSSKNGATDSIIALGVTPKSTGTIGSTTSVSTTAVGGSSVAGGSSKVEKSKKKAGKSKPRPAKKSTGSNKKSEAKKPAAAKKKPAAKKPAGKKPGGAKKKKR
jgi:hypothetical protein